MFVHNRTQNKEVISKNVIFKLLNSHKNSQFSRRKVKWTFPGENGHFMSGTICVSGRSSNKYIKLDGFTNKNWMFTKTNRTLMQMTIRFQDHLCNTRYFEDRPLSFYWIVYFEPHSKMSFQSQISPISITMRRHDEIRRDMMLYTARYAVFYRLVSCGKELKAIRWMFFGGIRLF